MKSSLRMAAKDSERHRWCALLAFLRNDLLRSFPAFPAMCMADKTIGNAGVTAARAELHIEPQEHMVPALFAERSKVEAGQVSEIRLRKLAGHLGARDDLIVQGGRLDVRPVRLQRPDQGGQRPQRDQKVN